ncbi:MAG TPA: PKD domain-containing protein, partial [Saprospiraceae bacterium]|nr:PKD domain-containing protein [Saprospiraceae bacterium]
DFVADKTTLASNESTQFSLVNDQGVKVLSWNFEGGSPASSTQALPSVKYNQVGSYDVEVTILNERSNDTLTYLKRDYITVMEPILPPVANFSVNRDTIYQGESVQFIDLSTNEPVDYSWTFSNGIPSLSKDKEPVVRYDKKGSHYVNLSVRNIAGNDNEIKQKFITVLEAKSPLAAFVSDKQVAATNEAIQFTDLSQNVPTSWKWYFPGASTEVSTEAHPVVQYSAAGSYDVSLVVQNFAGKDSIVKQNYIQIGGVGTQETASFVQQHKLYPNPVSGGELTVEFTLDKKRDMVIEVIDSKGSFASTIMHQRIKAGRNALFFSTETLVDGSYILLLRSTEDRLVKAIPFVVSRR